MSGERKTEKRTLKWCKTHNEPAFIYDDDSVTCWWESIVETTIDDHELVPIDPSPEVVERHKALENGLQRLASCEAFEFSKVTNEEERARIDYARAVLESLNIPVDALNGITVTGALAEHDARIRGEVLEEVIRKINSLPVLNSIAQATIVRFLDDLESLKHVEQVDTKGDGEP